MNWNDKITVHLADCMEIMKDYPDGYFDLAIVDPPYGLNIAAKGQFIKYGNKQWDKERPTHEYFNELFRVAKNQIIWGGNYFPEIWVKPCKDFIIWNKLNHHKNRSDVEIAWTSFNGLSKYWEYMWDGNRYGKKGNIQGVGKRSKRIHPTQKPVKLYEWLLTNYSTEGAKILDTHLGSGSHAIAAHYHENCGEFVGCELDADYYNDALKRFRRETAQLTIFQ